jgi:hypothetical protein
LAMIPFLLQPPNAYSTFSLPSLPTLPLCLRIFSSFEVTCVNANTDAVEATPPRKETTELQAGLQTRYSPIPVRENTTLQKKKNHTKLYDGENHDFRRCGTTAAKFAMIPMILLWTRLQ